MVVSVCFPMEGHIYNLAPVFCKSRLTTEEFVLTFKVCAVAMAMGLVKIKAEKMFFVYLKKILLLDFSSFAHYEFT